MTIDEAIEKSKELASTYRIAAKNAENIFISKLMQETKRKIYIKLAEEHEQLAEWLEELKTYRECNVCEYNKAIDDFVRFANTMPTVESEDGTIRPMWLEEIAEQLKAGGENEQSI